MLLLADVVGGAIGGVDGDVVTSRITPPQEASVIAAPTHDTISKLRITGLCMKRIEAQNLSKYNNDVGLL